MSGDYDTDAVDRNALERMWPHLKYSDKWPHNWWRYVGHTQRMRNGLVALRVGRGPRGIVRTVEGYIKTRSTISGEFTTSEAK